MQTVFIDDFKNYIEINNMEVFKSSLLQDRLVDLVKGETEDKEAFRIFQAEMIGMSAVEVIKKDLTKETVYIRPKQIEWDGDIVKGDLGEFLEVNDGVYLDTELNKALGRVGLRYQDEPTADDIILKAMDSIDIIKGKRGAVGEIRTWSGNKYQKTAQGWVPIKNQGGNEQKQEEEKKGKTFNYEGITWEVIKEGETESKVRAVTKSEKGKERVLDNKIIEKNSYKSKELTPNK